MVRSLVCVVAVTAACGSSSPNTVDASQVADNTVHEQFSCINNSHFKFTTPAGQADKNVSATALLDFVVNDNTGTVVLASGGAYPCSIPLTKSGTSAVITPTVCTDSQGLTWSFTSGGIEGLPDQVNSILNFSFKGTMGVGAAAQMVEGTGQMPFNCVKGNASPPVQKQDIPVTFKGMMPVAGFGTAADGTDATMLALFPDDLRIAKPDDSLFVVSRGSVFKINSTTFAAQRVVAPRGSRAGSPLPDATVTTMDVAANGDLLLGLTDGAQNYLGWLHANGMWELLKTLPAVAGHPLYRVRATPHGGILWTDGATVSTLDPSKFSPTGSPGFDQAICTTNDASDTTSVPAVFPHFCISALEVGPDDVIHSYVGDGESGVVNFPGGFANDGRLLGAGFPPNDSNAGSIQIATSTTTADNVTQYGCLRTDSTAGCTLMPPAVPQPAFGPVAFGIRFEVTGGPFGRTVTEIPPKASPLVMTSTGAIFGFSVQYTPFDFNSNASGPFGQNQVTLLSSFGLYEYKP